jgi:hypothetical protein
MKFTQYKNVAANYFTFLLPKWFMIMHAFIPQGFTYLCGAAPVGLGIFTALNNGVLNEFDGTSPQTQRGELTFDF